MFNNIEIMFYHDFLKLVLDENEKFTLKKNLAPDLCLNVGILKQFWMD